MKRTELEHFKTELSTRYAEQLEREQTHLTDDQRAHMCIGFEHGMGWLFRVLETAGGLKVEPDEAPESWVCRHCRLVSPADAWALGPGLHCPHCAQARETLRPPVPVDWDDVRTFSEVAPPPPGGSFSNVLRLCPLRKLGRQTCILNEGHPGRCKADLG